MDDEAARYRDDGREDLPRELGARLELPDVVDGAHGRDDAEGHGEDRVLDVEAGVRHEDGGQPQNQVPISWTAMPTAMPKATARPPRRGTGRVLMRRFEG